MITYIEKELSFLSFFFFFVIPVVLSDVSKFSSLQELYFFLLYRESLSPILIDFSKSNYI